MSTLLAAVDNSAAAGPVLAAAQAIARRLGWRLEAVHVRVNGDRGALAAAMSAEVELHEVAGPLLAGLAQAASRADIEALVLGARGFPSADRPLGGTALALIADLDKPIVIVPPEAPRLASLERILIPLDATDASADALRRGIGMLRAADVEIVILHVHFDGTLPIFDDQPQHETDAWMEEFLCRFCPLPAGEVRLELRTGRPGEHVLDVAAEVGADLIALGWKQDLAPGRAAVVREVLSRSPVPVILFPLPTADELARRLRENRYEAGRL